MRVTAPDGTQWEVTRRWYRRPRWRRIEGSPPEALAYFHSGGEGVVASILLAFVVVVLAAVLICVLLPAILFLLELPLLLALVAVARRGYVVEARSLATGNDPTARETPRPMIASTKP